MFDELIDLCKKASKLDPRRTIEGLLALFAAAAIVKYGILPVLLGH